MRPVFFDFSEDVTKHIGSRCDPSVGKGKRRPEQAYSAVQRHESITG